MHGEEKQNEAEDSNNTTNSALKTRLYFSCWQALQPDFPC